MIYIYVKWNHTSENEPVHLYGELDIDRWEVRKVEIYADGRKGFADANESFLETGLGKVPVPPMSEIAADPEFGPLEITREEFEHVWQNRRNR